AGSTAGEGLACWGAELAPHPRRSTVFTASSGNGLEGRRVMILVTGANGTTGREMVRQLAAAGRPVRALLRKRENAATLPRKGVEIALGSFDDIPSLDAAMKGVEAVYLISFVKPHQLAFQANV